MKQTHSIIIHFTLCTMIILASCTLLSCEGRANIAKAIKGTPLISLKKISSYSTQIHFQLTIENYFDRELESMSFEECGILYRVSSDSPNMEREVTEDLVGSLAFIDIENLSTNKKYTFTPYVLDENDNDRIYYGSPITTSIY